jgi:hypothetical protein
MSDPVEIGLIESLARREHHLTITTGPEGLARKVQLLKELLPGMLCVAILENKSGVPDLAGANRGQRRGGFRGR